MEAPASATKKLKSLKALSMIKELKQTLMQKNKDKTKQRLEEMQLHARQIDEYFDKAAVQTILKLNRLQSFQ